MESARVADGKLGIRTADIIGKGVEELEAKIRRGRERMDLCRHAAMVAVEALEEHRDLARWVKPVNLNTVFIDQPKVEVRTAQLDDLAEVLPLVRAIASRGYRLVSQSDIAANEYRLFRFAHRDTGERVLNVEAYVSTDESARCRVVETGEMRPVRKIVCDGEPAPPLEVEP